MKKNNTYILSIVLGALGVAGVIVLFSRSLPAIQNSISANQDQVSEQLQDLENKQDQQQEQNILANKETLDAVIGSNEKIVGILAPLSSQIASGQRKSNGILSDFIKSITNLNKQNKKDNEDRIRDIERKLVDSDDIQDILEDLSDNIEDSNDDNNVDFSGIITAIEGIELTTTESTTDDGDSDSGSGGGTVDLNTDCSGECLITLGYQNIGIQNSVLLDSADAACSTNGIATASVQPQAITDYFANTPGQATTQYGAYVYKDFAGVKQILVTLVNGNANAWFSINNNPTSSTSLRIYQTLTVCDIV